MKAEELRLGNLVGHNEKYCYLHDSWPNVDSKHLLIKWSDESWIQLSQGGMDLDNVYPVELTEEWLLRFGLKKNKHRWYIGDNPITDDWILVIMKTECFFYRNKYHEIKYVHQLQNLYYALTGEELKINKS